MSILFTYLKPYQPRSDNSEASKFAASGIVRNWQ